MPQDQPLNSDFPVVSGRTQLTAKWHADLPQPMNRRVDTGPGGEKSLVLWRPGLTAWLAAYNVPAGQRDGYLSSMRTKPTVDADEIQDLEWGNCAGFSWMVVEPRRDGGGKQFGLHLILAGTDSALHAAIYFDRPDDVDAAMDFAEGIDCA